MQNNNAAYFLLLQEQIETVYKSVHPDCAVPIADWKGREIARFQTHLQEKTNGRISEKSFYTYFKTAENDRLPRRDILDMLSQYCGFQNWPHFIYQSTEEQRKQPETIISKPRNWRPELYVFSLLAVMLFSAFVWNYWGKGQRYTFCFTDADTGQQIEDRVEVIILHEEESPEMQSCNPDNCFHFKTKRKKITLIAQASYYQPDTIIRVLDKKNRRETIQLKTDDYALMIHYFSTSKMEDWKKRRNQLDEMFADHARIFQVDKASNGMEMYNKTEFVNKMTMPLKSLKNVEIIETVYEDGKIAYMRFIQK